MLICTFQRLCLQSGGAKNADADELLEKLHFAMLQKVLS